MTDLPTFWWGCFVVSIVVVGLVLEAVNADLLQGSGRLCQIVAPHHRPRLLWLLAAGISMLLSVSLFFTGDHERGIFVAIWVPSILSAANLLTTRPR